MHVAFLLREAEAGNGIPHVSPVTRQIIELLRQKDICVDILCLDSEALDIAHIHSSYDLYVLKSDTSLSLSIAGALTVAGANIINSYYSCNFACDRVISIALLAKYGVPVPPTWVSSDLEEFRPLLDKGAIWIKAQRSNSRKGIVRITYADELLENEKIKLFTQDAFNQPQSVLAQQDVSGDCSILKVYVVGNKVWAVKKQYPLYTKQDRMGIPTILPSKISEMALTCGRALGLELYGIDFIFSKGQYYVIDINPFPGYKGVAEAPYYISEYIYERVQQQCVHNIECK